MRVILISAMLMTVALPETEAQNVNLLYKYGLKVYAQGTFSPEQQPYITSQPPINKQVTEISLTKYVKPTVAFQLRNIKRNFHEFELSDLTIGNVDGYTYQYIDATNRVITTGYKLTTTFISARYEYIQIIDKKSRSKFVPSIGVAAAPYYLRYKLTPYTAAQYPVTNTFIGSRIFVIPRLNYFIKKNIFLDVNIPICAADIKYSSVYEQNPTKPATANKTSTFNFDALPDYFSVRAGIGVKL